MDHRNNLPDEILEGDLDSRGACMPQRVRASSGSPGTDGIWTPSSERWQTC